MTASYHGHKNDVNHPNATLPCADQMPSPRTVMPALGPPLTSKTRWYGWQSLLVLVPIDVVTLVELAQHYVRDLQFGIYVFMPLHAVTGPIIHLAHGHAANGIVSLGLNVGVPGMALATGFVTSFFVDRPARFINAVTFLGFVGAQAIDVAILSKERASKRRIFRKSNPPFSLAAWWPDPPLRWARSW